jgi:hypothetical protein
VRKSTIPIVVALVAFLIACGGTPSKKNTITSAGDSTGAVAAATGAAGKTDNVPAGPTKFKVTEVGKLTLSDGSSGDVVVNTVKMQGKVIVANVTITCTAGVMKYNALVDWSALAGDGTKLDSSFDMNVKNTLSVGELGVGQKATGNVVFEGTAAQMKGVQLQYSPNFQTLAYWVAP